MPHNKNIFGSITKKLKRYTLPKRIKNFKDEESGVTVVEFAILAGPFFMLFMAIIETSLLFFAGQLLESSIDTVGRKVRVGIIGADVTQEEFKNEICSEAKVLFNCSDIKVDMQVVATYADLGDTPEPIDGVVEDSEYQFDAPGPEQIIMVTATYEWPVFTNYMEKSLSDLTNGNALLMGVSVFKSEPYL